MENKEVIAYEVVGGTNSASLCLNVNKLIKEGYQPLGIPFLLDSTGEVLQAMVRYKEVSDEDPS